MAQTDDSNDHFYTQDYRYGDKNLKLRQYNRDRAMTGMRGYPSDSEYMKAVADAGKERDDEYMRRKGKETAGEYETKKGRRKAKNMKKSAGRSAAKPARKRATAHKR